MPAQRLPCLTADEQTRFLNAFSQINVLGALGPLVDIHGNAVHQMHGNPRFLPWHRIYLVKMEQLLMMIDPTVCLPYWRSSDDRLSLVVARVHPDGGPGDGAHTVTRNPGASRRCRTPRR